MAIITIIEHPFTQSIKEIIQINFKDDYNDIFDSSPLIQYINIKTRSANKGSKARGSFANLYALYVLIEDYINNGFHNKNLDKNYSNYEGAVYTNLLKRQRRLPFGKKLQNHALNHRLNEEFKRFFNIQKEPIVRSLTTQRYWIQEDLINVKVKNNSGDIVSYNIATTLIEIIDLYVEMKQESFNTFIKTCQKISTLNTLKSNDAEKFIIEQLKPNIDARIFEIVSYAILKAKYGEKTVWIGSTKSSVAEESLILYKTGRTNANDGGIDFVMKPLGRFFQVTETLDVSKYFLDIDKIQKFPITFVVKSILNSDEILFIIKQQAQSKYKIESVVAEYLNAIEEIINVNDLITYFKEVVNNALLKNVMNEIISQSQVEFNQVSDWQ
ncbi:MAG: restriction endonuclease [Burkholderiales bacterium]|nr:restriction endonuclease [Burkholderiales bacterium]